MFAGGAGIGFVGASVVRGIGRPTRFMTVPEKLRISWAGSSMRDQARSCVCVRGPWKWFDHCLDVLLISGQYDLKGKAYCIADCELSVVVEAVVASCSGKNASGTLYDNLKSLGRASFRENGVKAYLSIPAAPNASCRGGLVSML